MKEEELLEEAKRRYPIGTRFQSLGGYSDVKVKDDFICDISLSFRTITNNGGVLYSLANNRWAEIISLPKEKTQLITNKVVI